MSEWDKDAARNYWKQLASGKPKGAPSKNFVDEANEVNTELALSAIATCPTMAHASTLLKERHGVTCTPAKLRVVASHHPEELDKLRERIAPKIEAATANNMLSNAWEATEVENLAIERAREMLEEDRIADPSKVARDLADVKAKNIDKRLALQGRPTQISEHRNSEEIIRALEGMGVARRVEIGQADD
jgi:hypothetical protein